MIMPITAAVAEEYARMLHPEELLLACPVCGADLPAHARCRCCTILVGPNHLEPTLNAVGLCSDCAAFLERRPWAHQEDEEDGEPEP